MFAAWALAVGLALALPSARAASTARSQHVQIELGASVDAVAPGAPFWLAVRLKMDPGWHTYWVNAGDAGMPTKIQWAAQPTPGWTFGEIQWPTPQRLPLGDSIVNYGYEGEVLLAVQATPPADLPPGASVTISASVNWLECQEICLPGSANLTLTLPVAASASANTTWQPAIAGALAHLPAPATTWSVSAWRTGDRLFLGLTPLPGAAAAPPNVYFFSADSQTQPSAPQFWQRAGDGWTLEMARADSAPADATLAGVLTANGSWTANGSVPALAINPPLGAAPAAMGSSATPAATPGLVGALALGFLGGLLLNIMPCVFPVLGLKVLGFVRQAGEERGRVVRHGLVFTAGVVVSMWALAGALQALRAAGEQLGWGFQLQSPGFVFALAAFFLVFGLSLSGVFEIGLTATGVGGGLTQRAGLAGSFFQGVLAVVVATPCTAPLLAPALGAAFALPPGAAFLTFTAIALGLAAPYLVLSVFPGLVRWLPRPGAWMETFKQAMAFPLYATVGFLVYVLAGQVDAEQFLNDLWALVLAGLAAWIYGRFATFSASPARRRWGQLGALVALGAGLTLAYGSTPPEGLPAWQAWSPAVIAELRQENRPIYVDFTARWCATCQLNKRVVFGSPRVIDAVRELKVALVEGDWTNRDPAITEELTRYGPPAVPLDLLYLPGHDEPVVLPKILTPQIVLDALGGKAPGE
jgi:thiol:disulfide interchange protein DsbD